LEVGDAAFSGRARVDFRSGGSVRSLLLPLLRFSKKYDYILEKDKLRILPHVAALAEWQVWWAAEEKK
jgi:hypothetical protein